MKISPIGFWLAEAGTVFLNSAIRGSLGGAALGGAGGTAASTTKLGEGMTLSEKIWLPAILLLGTMLANGWKGFVVWHDANPIPNPFPRPPAAPDSPP